MLTYTANGESPEFRLSRWRRVREYAVPPAMIEAAAARRGAGDWAGACAAARVDVEFDLRALARSQGHHIAHQLRSDLRHLAPDLLRWHFPRTAPHGLLRPGLTVSLARYPAGDDEGPPLHLVARTAPAWADSGQWIALALWDGRPSPRPHPHPHPHRRFRLDLHRHLWDARRAHELRERCGLGHPPLPAGGLTTGPELAGLPCAVDRWAAEAELLLRAEAAHGRSVAVRLGTSLRLVLTLGRDGTVQLTRSPGPGVLPVLPDAATWVPPDLELLRAGLIEPGRLHPLVAAALAPDVPSAPAPAPEVVGPRPVACRGGAVHRIGPVDGVLTALDHDPEEIRREELLAAFGGPPLPCLRAIDQVHRSPDSLPDIRERLRHGDVAGALSVVESLLGPEAVLRSGELRNALKRATARRITYGLYRSGLYGPAHPVVPRRRPRDLRARPRHTFAR